MKAGGCKAELRNPAAEPDQRGIVWNGRVGVVEVMERLLHLLKGGPGHGERDAMVIDRRRTGVRFHTTLVCGGAHAGTTRAGPPAVHTKRSARAVPSCGSGSVDLGGQTPKLGVVGSEPASTAAS